MDVSPAETLKSPALKLVYPAIELKSGEYDWPLEPMILASEFASSDDDPVVPAILNTAPTNRLPLLGLVYWQGFVKVGVTVREN
jgi:hypothetical protein